MGGGIVGDMIFLGSLCARVWGFVSWVFQCRRSGESETAVCRCIPEDRLSGKCSRVVRLWIGLWMSDELTRIIKSNF